jgi:flavin reductase (DIM6/NTAB) family NADH-FMN oxidoreductase RutF
MQDTRRELPSNEGGALTVESKLPDEHGVAPMQPTAAVLRSAFSRYPTGVTVITCVTDDGKRVGLTANSLSSLSLEPALLSWALRVSSPSLAAFRAAKTFAVNVLGAHQADVSKRFSSSTGGKFDVGDWISGRDGLPLLGGCAARFECVAHACHEAGDHVLFIGRIVSARDGHVAPLVFSGGRYHTVGPAP